MDITKGEKRKVERFANKINKRDDCRLTGYYCNGEMIRGYMKVYCEVCCNDLQDTVEKSVILFVYDADRRKSLVTVA